MIDEKDIGGIVITTHIEFDQNNNEDYLYKYDNISNSINDVVKKLGHEIIFETAEPILKSELEDSEEQKEIWAWNLTGNVDDWTGVFYSREEAIEDAIDTINWWNNNTNQPKEPMTIVLGECEFIPLRTDVDPDMVMEYLDELYADETGCEDYIYDGVLDEDRKWLDNQLSTLMHKFHKRIGLQGNWFKVFAEERIDLNKYMENKRDDN